MQNRWKDTGSLTEEGERIYTNEKVFAVEKDWQYLVDGEVKECPKCRNPLALGSDGKYRHYYPLKRIGRGICNYIEEVKKKWKIMIKE